MGTPTDSAAKGCAGMGRSSHRTSAKIVRASVKGILAQGVLGYCALTLSLCQSLCVLPTPTYGNHGFTLILKDGTPNYHGQFRINLGQRLRFESKTFHSGDDFEGPMF
jgi:hypothetical protein